MHYDLLRTIFNDKIDIVYKYLREKSRGFVNSFRFWIKFQTCTRQIKYANERELNSMDIFWDLYIKLTEPDFYKKIFNEYCKKWEVDIEPNDLVIKNIEKLMFARDFNLYNKETNLLYKEIINEISNIILTPKSIERIFATYNQIYQNYSLERIEEIIKILISNILKYNDFHTSNLNNKLNDKLKIIQETEK